METPESLKKKLKELALIVKIASQTLFDKNKVTQNPPSQSPES